MMLNFKFAVRRNGLLIINLISVRLNDFSSIAKKWKFCRIYWKRTLVEQTSLYTLVYRTFLYNEMNLKPPKKAPCWHIKKYCMFECSIFFKALKIGRLVSFVLFLLSSSLQWSCANNPYNNFYNNHLALVLDGWTDAVKPRTFFVISN